MSNLCDEEDENSPIVVITVDEKKTAWIILHFSVVTGKSFCADSKRPPCAASCISFSYLTNSIDTNVSKFRISVLFATFEINNFLCSRTEFRNAVIRDISAGNSSFWNIWKEFWRLKSKRIEIKLLRKIGIWI